MRLIVSEGNSIDQINYLQREKNIRCENGKIENMRIITSPNHQILQIETVVISGYNAYKGYSKRR